MNSITWRVRARLHLLTPAVAVGLLTALVAGLIATIGVTGPAEAASPAKSKIYLGVVGDSASISARTSSTPATHRYGKFEGGVPSARMLTVKFKNQAWKTTAALTPSSQSYKDVARWADTIKARGGEIFVAFHHEPESSSNTKFGTAAQYKAAYRKVVEIFRARGANNAVFTWQMTAYAFSADSSAHNYGPEWYPGDNYVDVVGADPYNWYTCGHGRGRWMSLQSLVDPVVAFAKSHGKQVALPEFASVRDSRRPAWIKQAGDYLASHDDVIAAVFYFNEKPTNSANLDCTWPLSSDADYSAFKELAGRSVFK